MWNADTEALGASAQKIRVRWGGEPVSATEAYALCVGSEPFRTSLLAALAAGPFTAYCWETPPLSVATAGHPFEYVQTEAPALAAAAPERHAFEGRYADDPDGDGIVSFANLRGDATLIVPCPVADPAAYTHLGAFVRHAPVGQAHALIAALGRAVLARIGTDPVWVSTAGLGVYWLHVRLDAVPKYYRHVPYKRG